MAEEKEYGGDDVERNEEPTPKRREDARKSGQVASSRSLIPAASLLGGILVLSFSAEKFMNAVTRLFTGFFSVAGQAKVIGREDLLVLSREAATVLLPIMAPLLGAMLTAAVAAGVLQTGFLWTGEPLRPNFSRINPFNGFGRFFSPDAAAEMAKALLSLVLLGGLGFFFLYPRFGALSALPVLDVPQIVAYSSSQGLRLLAQGVGILATLATFDYFYHYWRNEKRLRMSRQQLKEEIREHEGDPLIKARLKSLRQNRARQRMMAEVAKADVVVTNPQRIAVALRYRVKEMAAPKVVGKGTGYIAQKIRELAREKKIPIVENKPLAQLLYRIVEVGQEIPEKVYRAVAEVLAYVYRIRRGGLNAGGIAQN
jgi:flagellar biosynthetic protein FlhB